MEELYESLVVRARSSSLSIRDSRQALLRRASIAATHRNISLNVDPREAESQSWSGTPPAVQVRASGAIGDNAPPSPAAATAAAATAPPQQQQKQQTTAEEESGQSSASSFSAETAAATTASTATTELDATPTADKSEHANHNLTADESTAADQTTWLPSETSPGSPPLTTAADVSHGVQHHVFERAINKTSSTASLPAHFAGSEHRGGDERERHLRPSPSHATLLPFFPSMSAGAGRNARGVAPAPSPAAAPAPARGFSATMASRRKATSTESPQRFLDNSSRQSIQKASRTLSELVHTLANEPSLGLFRVEENCGRMIPSLVEKKRELAAVNEAVSEMRTDVQFSSESIAALNQLQTFESIRELMGKALEAAAIVELEKRRTA